MNGGMNAGDMLALLVAVAVLVYLTWALLKPESF
jgi:K+-transporting ATPase KdpF subunit